MKNNTPTKTTGQQPKGLILDYLAEHGETSVRQIAQAAGLTLHDALHFILILQADGRVNHAGPGRYSAVQEEPTS